MPTIKTNKQKVTRISEEKLVGWLVGWLKKLDPLCTADGNVKRCSSYRKQHGGYSRN